MRALNFILAAHVFAFVFFAVMTTVSVPIVLAIILSYLFCALPMLFKANSHEEYTVRQQGLQEHGANLVAFSFFLILPIAILITERALYGFEITPNPVLMRDQMIQRHRDGGGGGILAVIGNLSHVPAMYFFFKYLLLERARASKTVMSLLYITATIWIAGSRALLILIILLVWAKGNFKLPRLRNMLFLVILVTLLTYVFVLRAERSGLDLSVYLFRMFDHLRMSYDDLGEQIIISYLGPLALSVAYILHSIQTLSDILSSGLTTGLSMAPLVHFLSIFADYDNSSYRYQGLFLTSFGLFYHDLGILGVIIVLGLKCLVMYLASRRRDSFLATSLVLVLSADSVMGIWTSIINIVFVPYILLALVGIAVVGRVRFRLRRV